MKQVDKVFINQTLNVIELLQRNGVGLYIPPYQREYAWDEDNINQLIEDVEKGIESLYSSDSIENEIRFLGTIISVKEVNKTKIEPIDYAGIPESVEKIIDGQQRLTTILIFAVSAYCKFKEIEKKLSKTDHFSNVQEIISSWTSKLIEIICLDLKRGTPRLKPKLIRGSLDKWIKDGDPKEAYRSEISSLLSSLILFHEGVVDKFTWDFKGSRVSENKRMFDKWLANLTDSLDSTVPASKDLVDVIEQKDLWFYDRPEIVDIIKNPQSKFDIYFQELYKMCLICHYLLERSVFVLIQPISEEWAFDMFQSLNASGTPLTSIETFKPYVVSFVEQNGDSFKKSESSKDFESIERLFDKLKKANDKNKRTSEFLISFSNTYSASYKEMSSHFTSQRKWLNKEFSLLENNRLTLVKKLGAFATFMRKGWYEFESLTILFEDNSFNYSEFDLYQSFLIDNNHHMATTVLGRFYAQWLFSKSENAKFEYLKVLKILVAFYSLWRSFNSNTGLDSVYRSFFKDGNYWNKIEAIKAEMISEHFKKALEGKCELTEDSWVSRSMQYLNYNNKKLVKFMLILYGHDTIPCENNDEKGLCRIGRDGVHPFLSIDVWKSKDLKSIEHVAPQSGQDISTWDPELYTEEMFYNKIGNLTLLPIEINASAGNKGFEEKLAYYRFLGCKEHSDFDRLQKECLERGLNLTDSNIELLRSANYSSHLSSIKDLDYKFNWNKDFVLSRSKNILSICFKRLVNYLY